MKLGYLQNSIKDCNYANKVITVVAGDNKWKIQSCCNSKYNYETDINGTSFRQLIDFWNNVSDNDFIADVTFCQHANKITKTCTRKKDKND